MHLYVGRHCDLHSETIQPCNNLQVFFCLFSLFFVFFAAVMSPSDDDNRGMEAYPETRRVPES